MKAQSVNASDKVGNVHRAFFIETLMEAILHCGEDGNVQKVKKIIGTLYKVGAMPIHQEELDKFEWSFTRPTHDSSYYVADEARLNWIRDNAIGHRILRSQDFGMTELVFTDEQGEEQFRDRWC